MISIALGILISLLLMYFRQAIQIEWTFLIIVGISLIVGRIQPKWTCLAYVMAGIYVIDVLLVWSNLKSNLMNLNYEKMIYLVGILHMLEGGLTFSFGGKQSIPIMTYRGEKVVGGYQSHQRWLMPLLFFKIKSFYVPVIVSIVYANDSFTYTPEQKAKRMGLLIGSYGLLILYIANLVNGGRVSLTLAMFMMPLLHEGLFLIDDYIEKGELKYPYPSVGIRVMEIEENIQLDISRGDVIRTVNGVQLTNEEHFMELINRSIKCTLEIEKISGEKKRLTYMTEEIKAAKIVFLPRY